MKRKIILGIGIIILVVMLIGISSAAFTCSDGVDNDCDGLTDFPADNGCSSAKDNSEDIVVSYAQACLTRGQQLMTRCGQVIYDCDSTLCKMCVLTTDEGSNYSAADYHCYGLEACGFGGGGDVIVDLEPPLLDVILPIEGDIIGSRGVEFNVDTHEPTKIEKYDYTKRNWVTLCSSCNHFTRTLSFDDGFHKVQLRATDRRDNINYTNVSFTVDSKDPRIKKTEPRRGYADGSFYIQFTEENPVSLNLHYGNDVVVAASAYQDYVVDLEDDCEEGSKYWECNFEADLSIYTEQEIEYYLTLEDIAGNIDESKHVFVDVDTSDPVILNPEDMISVFDGKYVYFDIEIDEINLDYVEYIDNNDTNPRWKKMCSKLNDDGRCLKKISFKDGEHNVDVQVIDEAGNIDGTNVKFFTDSKKPKIKKTEPKKGFTDGNFYVEIQEENPVKLLLKYQSLAELEAVLQHEVDLDNDCVSIKGKSDKLGCDISVNLEGFNGEEIEYWFELEDRANQTDESKHIDLDVDTTNPVINNLESFFEIDEKYGYFMINITEENFDEVLYLDYKGNYKRLCSRLKDGLCEKKKGLRYLPEGQIEILVLDDAGNFADGFFDI